MFDGDGGDDPCLADGGKEARNGDARTHRQNRQKEQNRDGRRSRAADCDSDSDSNTDGTTDWEEGNEVELLGPSSADCGPPPERPQRQRASEHEQLSSLRAGAERGRRASRPSLRPIQPERTTTHPSEIPTSVQSCHGSGQTERSQAKSKPKCKAKKVSFLLGVQLGNELLVGAAERRVASGVLRRRSRSRPRSASCACPTRAQTGVGRSQREEGKAEEKEAERGLLGEGGRERDDILIQVLSWTLGV